MLIKVKQGLNKLKDPEKAKLLSRFFKTGKGQYGEGDVFLGVTVPEQRRIAKKYPGLTLDQVQKLLSSRIHEHRLTALFVLIARYEKEDLKGKKSIVALYLRNTGHINNWDLVDLSAHKILGDYLLGRDRKVLYDLARSKDLWKRRIAVLATFRFIKEGEFDDSLSIAEILLNDEHDLIRKAVGWMLREVGKRDQKTEEDFLKRHYRQMPRTMLRYAIEKFNEDKRKKYLRK